MAGTSLVVQWLRLRTPNSGGPGSIPGQGTRSCMPQLSPHAAIEDPTRGSKDPSGRNEEPAQPNKYLKKQ